MQQGPCQLSHQCNYSWRGTQQAPFSARCLGAVNTTLPAICKPLRLSWLPGRVGPGRGRLGQAGRDAFLYARREGEPDGSYTGRYPAPFGSTAGAQLDRRARGYAGRNGVTDRLGHLVASRSERKMVVMVKTDQIRAALLADRTGCGEGCVRSAVARILLDLDRVANNQAPPLTAGAVRSLRIRIHDRSKPTLCAVACEWLEIAFGATFQHLDERARWYYQQTHLSRPS